jgi:hypothetical protein
VQELAAVLNEKSERILPFVLLPLLKRAAPPATFLGGDADMALDILIENASGSRMATELLNAHASCRHVRSKVASSLARSMQR